MCLFESCTSECATYFNSNWGHDAVETIKNIYCVKGEGTADYSIITKWLKNLDDQARLSKLKIVFQGCGPSHKGKFSK